MHRRNFIKYTGLTGLGLMLGPQSMFAASGSDVGIQLYTLRNEIEKDLVGTLEQVAALGFSHVEFYPTSKGHLHGYSAAEFTKLLKLFGLNMHSMHIPLKSESFYSVRNNFEKLLDMAGETGTKYLVCPYLSEEDRKTIDNYKVLAQEFNVAGKIAKGRGINFCYHNHDFEFKAIDGILPYDILLKECDKKYVNMEMDLYWVKKAGKEPVDYFKNYPGRFPLWHVKDMTGDERMTFAEVGSGVIDFKEIFAMADTAGLKKFFVEQDKCPGNPLESVEKSINYLKESNF